MTLFYARLLPAEGILHEGPAYHPELGKGTISMEVNPASGKMELCFFRWGHHPEQLLPFVKDLPELQNMAYSLCSDKVRAGSHVWWNDPAGETSAFYHVDEISSEDGVDYDNDTLIRMKNDFSETEARPGELNVIVGPISDAAKWITDNLVFKRLDWQWASIVLEWELPVENDYIMVKCPCCGEYT